MAAGYTLGPVFRLERETRVRQLFVIGAVVTVGFVFLRAIKPLQRSRTVGRAKWGCGHRTVVH